MNVSASAMAVAVTSFSHLCINDSLQRGRSKCWFNRDLSRSACLITQRNFVLLSSIKRKSREYPRFSTIKSQKTYTSEITILADMPLYESPHASFDRYMEDKPRVFKAIFPENRGTQRLNEDEWRIRMEPIAFLFLTAWPVVNMRIRCKTKGKEYPSGVPTHTSTVLELKITKWDLEGVTEGKNKPSEFRINMDGVLYPDRKGARSRIKVIMKRKKQSSFVEKGNKKQKKPSKITDLNFDVLKHVMFYVAASPDGAGNLARTFSVCRLFKELADDSEILKAAVFDHTKLSSIHASFWRPDGMLSRCLQIGNPTAFYTIRTNAEMLNGSYQILKRSMFRGKMILLARSRALEAANTRARKKAVEDAINECSRTFDAVDAQIQTIEQFLEMLVAAVKVMKSQIPQ